MKTLPRIFAVCVVKNEADIIAYTLSEAAKWAYRIYVLDNGSEDDTWEIVKKSESDIIVPWTRDERPFCEGLRAEVFNHFREESTIGDWWCRLDADEIYPDDPRQFLCTVPLRHHVVWGTAIEFYLTTSDYEELDFRSPLHKLLPELRYYRSINSETRFFRYRPRLSWPSIAAWPRHIGVVHPKRLPFYHYKFRTPEQIQRRISTRLETVSRGTNTYWSQLPQQWKTYLVAPTTCSILSGRTLAIDEASLPRHVEPLPRRIVKMILHATGVWP